MPLTGILVAVGFLTRIPVPHPGIDAKGLGRAVPWFPIVGVLVGATIAFVRVVADLAMPVGPATLLGVLAGILLTGGLHEDGLADVADGLGAHVKRERRLQIMRDPHVGTFGIVALIAAIGLSWSLMSGLTDLGVVLAAITAHVVGRWVMIYAAWRLPAVEGAGTGALLQPTTRQVAATTVVALILACAATGLVLGTLALVIGGVIVRFVGGGMSRRLDGINGDVLGALGVGTVVAVLALLASNWS